MIPMPASSLPQAEGRRIDGILLVDKPLGITSHDVVSIARRALGTRRVGHAGTLDPFATGLLVLMVGNATRLLPYIDGEPKVYEASVAFGVETNTDDSTGTVANTSTLPEPERVRAAIAELTGNIEQIPPSFSAKQVEGRRAYDAARHGAPLELAPVQGSVQDWTVPQRAPDRRAATITCGGGTYIRALARDLGRLSGSAAHLASLRRTRSGPFDVGNAVSIEGLRTGQAAVIPARMAVAHLPSLVLSSGDVALVRHGRPVGNAATSVDAPTAALVDDDGRLVAIAARAEGGWQPRVVLPEA